MSSLATKLAKVEVSKPTKEPKTPCYPLYGYGDSEDLAAVERLRKDGAEWNQVQETIDKLLEIEKPLELNKFIRHWRAKCSCWNES